MKNKLNRLLRPHMGMYFTVIAIFGGLTMLLEQYWLGVSMLFAATLLYALYNVDRIYRRRRLLQYLEQESNSLESSGRGEAPFPAVMVRLGDGAIVWSNQLFGRIIGGDDNMKNYDLKDLVPGLGIDWLTDRKTECPYDVTIHGRRYRVHGTLIRGDGTMSNMLGVMYFSDPLRNI